MTKAEETKKNKAFQLRYKKPIVKNLNLDTIKNNIERKVAAYLEKKSQKRDSLRISQEEPQHILRRRQ